MRWTALLVFLLAVSLSPLTTDQLGVPLGRCGAPPRDPGWPQNQLPGEQVSLEAPKKPTVDMVKLQEDARELADLSVSIHADVKRVNRGLLAKDVVEKLKRVEKLSKRLRRELTR